MTTPPAVPDVRPVTDAAIEQRTRALPEHEREFWRQQRQALLMQIDAIERLLELNPRTAELRKERR